MTGTVEQELNSYISRLNATQKKALLAFIKSMLPQKQNNSISIEQYNKELEEAEAEIERGEFYTHEEVVATLDEMFKARKKEQAQ
jgi:predicted transcriptional regulator